MSSRPDKKDHIIAAAEKLFAIRGYDSTSVRDICQEADVNVAMVNYYFGSKDGLFREMVEQKASFMRGKLEALVADKTITPIEKLQIAIEHQVNRMFEHRPFTMVVIREMSKDSDNSMKNLLLELFLPNMKLLRNIINQGIRTGGFRKIDIELTISTLIGSIWNIISTGDMMIAGLSKPTAPAPGPEAMKKRLIKHLHQLIRNHLLTEAHGDKS
jgi:AcrR family transcriptional regulator